MRIWGGKLERCREYGSETGIQVGRDENQLRITLFTLCVLSGPGFTIRSNKMKLV